MNSINFGYSTKNIPIPNNKQYLKTLINKSEIFIRNIRWKAFFYLNPDAKKEQIETFGFNSVKNPPFIKELKKFEDKLLDLVQTIQFNNNIYNNNNNRNIDSNTNFQQKITNDINNIKRSNDVYVAADKTTNFYKLKPKQYKELIKINLQKDYLKAPKNSETRQKLGDKIIASQLKLDERIDITAKKEAFITLKDHKDNFKNNPKCRLINPCKTEIGKISKQILDNINNTIRNKTELNQWKNTDDVIKWFNNIKSKKNCKAITFDICEFYPSINKKLLNKAIEFASKFINITKQEREIIMHTKKSTIYNEGIPWIKKKSDFDVAMGSFDSAETCELVGLYLLNELKEININCGLYRDDGLAITNKTPRETEKLKKQICQIFRKNDLKITIKANLKIVEFLDLTINIENETYEPYIKPNNIPLYVNIKSNHPPSVIKNIPEGINKRLANISANESIFNNAIKPYQEALKNSGYNHKLEYNRYNEKNKESKKTRIRSKNVTWFNPPFSMHVKTNIGKKFLKLIDECFPKNHILNKIMNRHTIKISYSCMPNLGQIINIHNKKILNNDDNNNNNNNNNNNINSQSYDYDSNNNKCNNNKEKTISSCNCRKINECPVNNKCLTKGVIYQALVIHKDTNKKTETYIGSTSNSFKTRYLEHKNSFVNKNKKHATTLSEYVWKMKEENEKFEIKWKIIEKSNEYSPINKKCNLCLTEKLYIITKRQNASLNKRDSLVSSCRHKRKYKLKYN